MKINDYSLLFSPAEQELILLANELYGQNTTMTIMSAQSTKMKDILFDMNCYSYLQSLIIGELSIGMLTREKLLMIYIQLRVEKNAFSLMGMTDYKEIDSIIATTRKMITNELKKRKIKHK